MASATAPSTNPAATTDATTCPTGYVIESLFQRRRAHLVVGTSGAGKTRWLLPIVDAWRRGEDVLDRHSTPLPFGYLVCDRPKESAIETLSTMGLDPSGFPCVSLMDRNDYVVAPDLIPRLFPAARVVYVEALAALMPGKMNDYQDVLRFFRTLYAICKAHDLTIIGTVHVPKLKEGEGFVHTRDNVMGSAGWAACADTICYISPKDPKDITCSLRELSIMHRNAPAERHLLDFDGQGRLVLATSLPDWRALFESELLKIQPGECFPTSLVLGWAVRYSVAQRNAERWLKEMVELGMVEKTPAKGIYRRPVPS